MHLKRKYMHNASVDFSQNNYYIKKDKEDLRFEENEKEENESCVDNDYNRNYYYYYQQQLMQRQVNGYNNNNNNIHMKQQYNYVKDNGSNVMKYVNNGKNDVYQKQDTNMKKGWIYSNCNHFNYGTRKQCIKCYIVHDRKNVKHNKKYTHEENYKTNGNNNNNGTFSERIGDWICINCDNLNFAFRTFCNRYQLAKPESNLHNY